MIHHLNVVESAIPARAVEHFAAATSFANDVGAVLDAARPFEATLVMLGELAIVKLDVALYEAAGQPYDARWRAAHLALGEFVAYGLRHAKDARGCAPFARLASFLRENADLATTPAALHDAGDTH